MCCQVTRLAEYLVTFVTPLSHRPLTCVIALCVFILHWSHMKGFSPIWALCILFFPVLVLLCLVRVLDSVNALSHWSHWKAPLLYGFSYVSPGIHNLWMPYHTGHTQRLLSCMGSLMLCQATRLCESLVTLVTLFTPVLVSVLVFSDYSSCEKI